MYHYVKRRLKLKGIYGGNASEKSIFHPLYVTALTLHNGQWLIIITPNAHRHRCVVTPLSQRGDNQ